MPRKPRNGVPAGTFNIRITDAERAYLKQRAKAARMPVGEYVRRCVPGLAESNDAAAVNAVGKEPASAT